MSKYTAAFVFALIMMFAGTAFAAVTVRYYNKDSKTHTFEAVCSGSKKKVTFKASTTSSTTIQGSGPCKVKTSAGEVTLKGGEKIEIKNGKITIK